MPYSVNGIGTSLIDASKRRIVGGHVQFDAIEALQLLFCPIVPYKVLHVMSYVQAGYERHSYRSIRLRFAPRLIVKAFLRRWSNTLLFVGCTMTPLFGYICATMARPMKQDDYIFLALFIAALLLGVVLRLVWLFVNRTDERIKDIIGPHDLGTADPFYWPADIAEAARTAILGRESLPKLVDVSRRAMASGDLAKAMLCARLAMQDHLDPEAPELFRQLLRMSTARSESQGTAIAEAASRN